MSPLPNLLRIFLDKSNIIDLAPYPFVTFGEIEGKTKLTLTHVGLPSGEDQDNCRTGWNESFDKLAEVLAKG